MSHALRVNFFILASPQQGRNSVNICAASHVSLGKLEDYEVTKSDGVIEIISLLDLCSLQKNYPSCKNCIYNKE